MHNDIEATSPTIKQRRGKRHVVAGGTRLTQPLSEFESLGLDLAASKASDIILATLRQLVRDYLIGGAVQDGRATGTKCKAAPVKVTTFDEPTLAVRTCAYAKCKHGPLDPKWPVARKVHDDSCLKRFVKTFKAEQKALLEASEEVELSSDDTMAAPASEEMDAPK